MLREMEPVVKGTVRWMVLVAIVLIGVGIAALFWFRFRDEIPNSMSYQLHADGRVCEMAKPGGCYDVIRKEGKIAVPYWGTYNNGTAVLYVEDDVPAEMVGEAFNHFAGEGVPRYVVRRKGGTKEESYSYVAPLMGLGANGPIRQEMDQAKEGHFDAGGEIGLGKYTVLSVELMDDQIFFGDERMSDEVARSKLTGGKVSALVVRFRKGSNLLGLWKLVRFMADDPVEIIPFARPSERRE